MIYLIAILLSCFSYSANKNILEASRVVNGEQETIILKQEKTKDLLYINSNFLNKSNKEFGLFTRNKSNISQQFKTISRSQKTIPKSISTSKGWSPHAWVIRVYGKVIDKSNLRYSQVVKTIQNLNPSQWKPIKTISIEIRGTQIHVFKNKEKLSTKNFFKVCDQQRDGLTSCSIDEGLIYILPK